MKKHKTLLYVVVGIIILKFLISQVIAYMDEGMFTNDALENSFGTESAEKITLKEVLNNKYDDLTENINLIIDPVEADELNVLSGVKKGTFELSGDVEFEDIEVMFKVSNEIADDLDVLAIYQYYDSAWRIFGYYEVVQDEFIIELKELGTFAIVNKTKGEKNTSPIIADTSRTTERNFRDRANEIGCFSSEQDIEITHWYAYDYSDNIEFVNTNFKTSETGRIVLTKKNSEEYVNFYFENCTFDAVTFGFENKGHYVFNNCLFINSPISTLEVLGNNDDINIYVYNSTLRDNKPDKEEFNANQSSERAWKYTAIGYRKSNATVHVVKSLIENYMTNTTIYENENTTANRLYFEYSTMRNVEGHGIAMNSDMKGRIDNNDFYNIGELRGKNGYAIKYDPRFGGSGVGGNAIFTSVRNREMRVYKNYIKNVMENAIEGHYYCVNDNIIDGTGYRYYEPCTVNIDGEDVELPGYQTVSTEAIWGGSWQVKNNIIRNVHGRGIMISRWDDVPTEVSGNVIIKGGINVIEDYSGIKITSTGGSKNVLVTNNRIYGFVNKYRVQNTTDGLLENIVINDIGDGKLMGSVFSGLRGVKLTSDRQQSLNFVNPNMNEMDNDGNIIGWNTSNLLGTEYVEEDGISYFSIKSNDKYGRIFQEIDLPKETCIVCLKVRLRATSDGARVFVTSKDDSGKVYETDDGGSYSEYKLSLNGIDDEEFRTFYVCFKAKDHTTIGVFANEANQILDIEEFNGYYMIDDVPESSEGPLNGELILNKDNVHEGEVISILFKINNEEVIDSIQGEIEYDDDLWEPITTSSFIEADNWNEVSYNSTDKTFSLSANNRNNQSQNVFEIKLKSSISDSKKNQLRSLSSNKLDTRITFKNIGAYSSDKRLIMGNVEKEISISYILPPDNNNTVNNTIVNNTANNIVANNTVNNTIVNNTVNNTTVNNTINNMVNNTVKNTINNTVNNTVNNTANKTVNNTINNFVNNTVRNTVNNTTKNTVNNTVYNSSKSTDVKVTNVTYIMDSSSNNNGKTTGDGTTIISGSTKGINTGDLIPIVVGSILGIIFAANIIQTTIKRKKKII